MVPKLACDKRSLGEFDTSYVYQAANKIPMYCEC